MVEFVAHGHIGGIRPGMTRHEVVEVARPPPNWKGKEFGFSPRIADPFHSPFWLYHDGATCLGFDETDIVRTVDVHVNRIVSETPAFADWPDLPRWSCETLESWLLRHGFRYLWLEADRWICADTGF